MAKAISWIKMGALWNAGDASKRTRLPQDDLLFCRLANELCALDESALVLLKVDKKDVEAARARLRQRAEDAILDAGIAVEAVRVNGSSYRPAVRAVQAARVAYDEALASLPLGSERLEHLIEDLTSLEEQVRPLREKARERYQNVVINRY